MPNSTTSNTCGSPYLFWTSELAIGHDAIDADHQRIFDIANRVQTEIQEIPEHSIVGEVLVELIEHTGDHFLREESLMQAYGFPHYEEHKREHATLMQQVNLLHRRFMDGNNNLSAEVAAYLRDWLIPHIRHSDMELGKIVHRE